MFSVQQKRDIAEKVQQILRETRHPELPKGEIAFSLHVEGAESWPWADIRNNGAVTSSLQGLLAPAKLKLAGYIDGEQWAERKGNCDLTLLREVLDVLNKLSERAND